MKTVSGFSFVHNGIHGGYPFVEAIKAVLPYVDDMTIVDMQSTDETISVIEKFFSSYYVGKSLKIVQSRWRPGTCEDCLDEAYNHNVECIGDIVWMFEADEVFDDALAVQIRNAIDDGDDYLSVYRVQVEQNFQRCRWYPDFPVLRVFPKGSTIRKGHTGSPKDATSPLTDMSTSYGYIWDISNCFRDDWRHRIEQNAELWGELPQYRATPFHFTMQPWTVNISEIELFLGQPHWTWNHSPFNLPYCLQHLVGVTSYREYLKLMEYI